MGLLRELAAEKSNKEIAATLGVAEGTVKVHATRSYEKLGASGGTEAFALALERGTIRLSGRAGQRGRQRFTCEYHACRRVGTISRWATPSTSTPPSTRRRSTRVRQQGCDLLRECAELLRMRADAVDVVVVLAASLPG